MQLDDYIIDHRDLDWPALLRDWSWLLPPTLCVWIVNRFGDLFVALEDGSVHMLDVGAGTFEKVAESRDDFSRKADEGDAANVWFMIPLIDELVASGLALRPGQCYSYRKPPVIGGEYTAENTCVLPIAEHFGVYASLHQQMRDLPDGTWVRIQAGD